MRHEEGSEDSQNWFIRKIRLSRKFGMRYDTKEKVHDTRKVTVVCDLEGIRSIIGQKLDVCSLGQQPRHDHLITPLHKQTSGQ